MNCFSKSTNELHISFLRDLNHLFAICFLLKIISSSSKRGCLLIFCFSLLYSNLNNKRILESLLLFLSCYFFISTTIHPWYIINLILVGIISGYAFPIIWSLTVFWSYNAYSSNIIQENIVLQLFSYCLVYGCFFYEIYYKKLGHHLQKPNFFSS